MVNIYARYRGAILRIDGHGVATFEVPCDVPEDVAEELCGSDEFVTAHPEEPAGEQPQWEARPARRRGRASEPAAEPGDSADVPARESEE